MFLCALGEAKKFVSSGWATVNRTEEKVGRPFPTPLPSSTSQPRKKIPSENILCENWCCRKQTRNHETSKWVMENNVQRVKMLSFPINDLSFTTRHDCNGVARDGFLWCHCQLEWKFYFDGFICLLPLYDMINAYNYMHLSMAMFYSPAKRI